LEEGRPRARVLARNAAVIPVMPISDQEKPILARMLQLIGEHGGRFYGIGLQTTVLSRDPTGWRNLLTKIGFERKGAPPAAEFRYDYPDAAIIQRRLSLDEAGALLEGLASRDLIETGGPAGAVPFQPRLHVGRKSWWAPAEWTEWPAEIFSIELQMGAAQPNYDPLVASDPPYFPSLEQVLWQVFGLRNPSWMNYFRGLVVVVLPDYRARISRLTVALGYLKVDLDSVFLRPEDMAAKVYAENSAQLLAQKTIIPDTFSFQVDLDDRPTFASVALVSRPTGETLHIKSFQEGRGWQDPGVVFETSPQEIEQMLLVGENETLEFKDRVQAGIPSKLAKTAVAFANTKGGTILIGVDDDGRVVGCEAKGLGDTVTNILRAQCDPPPQIETEAVRYHEKSLLLVKVIQSGDRVHIVKDHGPWIRANATNRVPNADELARLCSRQAGALGSTLSP
jgi:hypothetical protein